MGGGRDSRIPSILNGWFQSERPDVRIVIRTYSFDPGEAAEQIDSWYDELHPSLVIGESMGANHALALLSRKSGDKTAAFPLLLVSPALGGPKYMYRLAFLTKVPGIPALFEWIYKPKPGDRQEIFFRYGSLRKWKTIIRQASDAVSFRKSIQAFFGTEDHYRKSGIVSVRSWRNRYGECHIYDGTHFMEEDNIQKMLIPAILTGIDNLNSR